MENYTLSDIAAVMGNSGNSRCNDGGGDGIFGGGYGGILALIIVFILLFGRGYGYGMGGGEGSNCGGGSTVNVSADLQRGFDTSAIMGKLDGIGNGICDSTFALNNAITNGFANTATAINAGFNTTNMGIMQGFNGVQTSICQGLNGVNTGINQLGYQIQQCCCDMQRENSRNTQMILDKLCQSEIDSLRDRLSLANTALTNQTLANDIIQAVRPIPQPAWLTCSPYQQATIPVSLSSSCGSCFNNNGCGCAANV